MDSMKKQTENIFTLPVALLFQNTTNLDNAIDSPNLNNASNSVIVLSANIEKSFTSSNVEKISDLIRRELKWGFILHTYGFGCLFFILAFYTFFSILNLRSFISSRPFMSTINGFLCLLGVSRAGSLFIDPYNLKETMPKILGQIIWDLGFPSIISAFCLVQMAFLQLTQLKIGPESLRRKSCLSLIVAAHFMLTIGMDIIVASHENLLIVKYVIQYIFLSWGVVLCCSFLYSGYKIMSMIRNIPGGFKHRDLPDPNHKGIMQLAMLAPHNNLAGSVTTALLPTLCAPKIHQKDNTSTSTLGFRNEGNSRILESESIPMLEEMAGSSGDERSPQPLARAPSFQNQTRNTQKFNLKPKLSLKSCPEIEQNDENQEQFSSCKATKSQSKSPPSKFTSFRANKFDISSKPNNDSPKSTETFVTTKDIQEFKSKIQSGKFKTDSEQQRSLTDKKHKSEGDMKKTNNVSENTSSLIPDILISNVGRSNFSEIGNEKKIDDRSETEADCDSVSEEELKQSFTMEEKIESKACTKSDSKKNKFHSCTEGKLFKQKNDNEKEIKKENRKLSDSTRRGESGNRRNNYRESIGENCNLTVDMYSTRRSSDSSALSDMIESKDDSYDFSPTMRDRRKVKSLTWKKKFNEDQTNATQERLLPQENKTTDVSLSAILNHIAYVNRAALSADTATQEELEKIRKSKVEWVLNVTYITAMWGLMLCLSNMGRIYGPYGMPEPRYASLSSSSSNSTNLYSSKAAEIKSDGILSSPWPWLWFQTFCRALELAMGCAMANITRQPTATYRNPHTLSIRHRDTLYNI